MIIDTSAIIAILFSEDEDDADIYARAITRTGSCRGSAATFVETAIVVAAQTKNVGGSQLDVFFRSAGVIVEPVTEQQAHIARQAFVDFGKGRHAAVLNCGDCFSYALAKSTVEPLLFKGKDFAKTDLLSAK